MNIHLILSRDVCHYLGLKSEEVKTVAQIPSQVHWYARWRMDLWPNELASLPERTDFSPLILVNKATRFALLELDSTLGIESFKGNIESYLQWPLHLGAFPGESYGRMKIHFYRGVDRSLATSMKEMRERVRTRGVPAYEIYRSSSEFERIFKETQGWLNDIPLKVNGFRSATEMMGKMIREDPPTFFPSRIGTDRNRGETGTNIPYPGTKRNL